VIPPRGQVNVTVGVQVNPIPSTGTSVTVSMGGSTPVPVQQTVIIPPANNQQLTDPLGRVTGCAGEILPDYTGFSISLYEAAAADPTGTNFGQLLGLTPTEVPDIPGNNVAEGLEPNRENSNPFFLSNAENGKYSFLLDVNRDQLTPGRRYILLVSPPPGGNFNERRIRIDIGQTVNGITSYTATSLDGRPISATNGSTSVNGTIDIRDAERVGLSLAVLDLSTAVCDAQSIQIIKTGDRAAAEPGDTVIYRLAIRNLSNTPLTGITVTDELPLGLSFRSDSVRAELDGQRVSLTASNRERQVNLSAGTLTLAPGKVLNIAYAARLTPDSMRGRGINSAIVEGRRTDTGAGVKDGPATHKIAIRPGIVSDCGTIIGRVFLDKNFDGEQQKDEPGIPNAVVFLDDGNRIVTDNNGLFSVANAISGYRTGTLDLTSVPGYNIAPNHRFAERNSQSRLVHLEPGGLVRMNFAVTPVREGGNR
jgi:uncharacterized repeat protein (TIGR01451 family)